MKLALAGTQFHANFPRRRRAKTNVPTSIPAFVKSPLPLKCPRKPRGSRTRKSARHRSTPTSRDIVGIPTVYTGQVVRGSKSNGRRDAAESTESTKANLAIKLPEEKNQN